MKLSNEQVKGIYTDYMVKITKSNTYPSTPLKQFEIETLWNELPAKADGWYEVDIDISRDGIYIFTRVQIKTVAF